MEQIFYLFRFITFTAILLVQTSVFAASSTNYKISTQVLDAGGMSGQSSSYRLLGKAREKELKVLSGTGFKIEEGFLKCAYSAFGIGPLIIGIFPSTAENTQPVSVVVSGANFKPGAKVKLSLAGEADIVAVSVFVANAGRITCIFDITNSKPGFWDLAVTNPDGRSAIIRREFEIKSPKGIIGPVEIRTIADRRDPRLTTTSFKYRLSQNAELIFNVYNIRGEKIWTWTALAGAPGGQEGLNEVLWDGITAFQGIASSGVYIVHLSVKVDGQVKMMAREKFAIIK